MINRLNFKLEIIYIHNNNIYTTMICHSYLVIILLELFLYGEKKNGGKNINVKKIVCTYILSSVRKFYDLMKICSTTHSM